MLGIKAAQYEYPFSAISYVTNGTLKNVTRLLRRGGLN
jgi:hypothetical protein